MSQLEMKVLIGIFYFFCFLIVSLTGALVILGILKQYFPDRYRVALRRLRRYSRLERWIRAGQFDKVIAQYRHLAEKKVRLKFFYLGLAKLNEYQFDDAISLFEHYITHALGDRQILTAQNYIGMAYLSKKSYGQAYQIFEQCRVKGYVFTAPYILALIANKQYARAKDFYETYPTTLSIRNVLEALVSFDPANANTMEAIKKVTEKPNPHLHMSQPAIDAILEQYELELYFRKPDALKTLQKEAIEASQIFSEQPDFFQNSLLQWLRRYLVQVSESIPAQRFIWIDNTEMIVDSIQIPTAQDVFKKILWLSKEIHRILRTAEYESLFHDLLPASAIEIMAYDGFAKYHVYEDDKLRLGFMKVIETERRQSVKGRILSMKEIDELKEYIMPLLTIQQDSAYNLRPTIDWLVFEWIENKHRKLHWQENVIPMIERIPIEYQFHFEPIKNYFR